MTCLVASIALAICALVVGCSDRPQTPQPAAAALAPPARTVPIDGSYNGIAQLVSGAAMSCGTEEP